MTDFDVQNHDLVYKNGDFELATVPQVIPFVIEVATQPKSWVLDEFFGVNLRSLKEDISLERMKIILMRFKNISIIDIIKKQKGLKMILTVGGVDLSVDV